MLVILVLGIVRQNNTKDNISSSSSTTSSTSFIQSSSNAEGQHCGGFIANAATCPSEYHCKLNLIADTGGVCVKN